MERYLDKSGEYLYIKYSFLENFKNFNTLLFVVNNNTNNIYTAFIKTSDIIYIIYIDSFITYQEFIKLSDLKQNFINNNEIKNKNINTIFKKINILEFDLKNIINDWLNDLYLQTHKKYEN